MSVATEFPPVVHIPRRARRPAECTATVLPFPPRPAPAARPGVTSLRGAAARVSARYPVRPVRAGSGAAVPVARSPLRITPRGYAVVGVLAALVITGLLWLAHSSAPAAAPRAAGAGAAVVTVRDGDTLWSIASRIAPARDPRGVVATLERINHLSSPLLQPGQRLRTR